MRTPTVSHPATAPPEEPVRVALDDPEIQLRLLKQARAVVGRCFLNLQPAARSEIVTEAIQETRLRALQNGQNYDPAIAAVGAWLGGILNHVLRELLRQRQGLPPQEPSSLRTWEDHEAFRIADGSAQVLDRLAAADYLGRLSSEQQEILRLAYMDGLDHRQLAERLGISPGNARIRLYRALQALRISAGAGPREDRP